MPWFCSEYEGGPEWGPFTPEERAEMDGVARRPSVWRWEPAAIRRADCPYCDGSGRAPSSDLRTSCGFCR
jgi:hypothetical protein